MTPERWKKIEDIFQEALDIPAADRARFIADESGDDAELRAEVEKLVARCETEEEFLESPVWTDSKFLGNTFKNQIARSLESEIARTPSAKSFSGRKIGVYLLTEQIGKGGMGIVYAAERVDGEFSQKVAIKLIKRGMDTDFIINRFRHERQILASLNHPNIARLLDGGTTIDDSPYFVMEFIEGEAFFKFCEKNSLDLRARLKLFLAVSGAVAYAHRQKIIHRDIKPGNILVTNEGTPKLLDFGIAKILDPDLIHESINPTATAMRLMTPEYASPEQARGDEITESSDQYSLGALLYELVTGARPYKFPSRAPHEIARVICEISPSSVVISSSIVEKSDKEQRTKDEELSRIILKSLRKTPSQRYASVEDFAADIERFLNHQTVRAEIFKAETGENEVPATNVKIQERTRVFTDENKLTSVEENTLLIFGKSETTALTSSIKTIPPRRKGVKQGVFSMILAFLLIPFFVVFTGTGILPPQLSVFCLLLFFFGGLIRIVYALLFEEKQAAQILPEPVKSEIAEAETKLIADSAPRRATIEDQKPSAAEKNTPGEKTIAVLPFKNLNAFSGEDTGESGFLTVGLADALITRLSNVKRLLVRPTSSVLRFAADDADSFAAGEELNTAFVLDGNFFYANKRIRVSVQLLDVSARLTVWAERFDEDFTDVLSLEDNISAKVAESLVPRLTGEERSRLEKRGTDNSEAHEAYLRGRFYWNSFTEDGFRQARFFYQKAIGIDPNYVLAYAGLTDYYLWLGAYAMLPPKDCFPPAREAAERAVALDNNSAEAHSALGFAQLCDGYDWVGSEQSALRAIELNPNYVSTYVWYTSHLLGREKFDEAFKQIEHAIKLDPFAYQSHNTFAFSLYFARRYTEAIAKAEENIERFPAFSLPYNALSVFLRSAGRTSEAVAAARYSLKLSGKLDRTVSQFILTAALAADGKRGEAEELLRTIEAENEGKYLASREYVQVYAALGEKEKTINALERSFENGELLIWLKDEPSLDLVRDDPRYWAIAEKLNL